MMVLYSVHTYVLRCHTRYHGVIKVYKIGRCAIQNGFILKFGNSFIYSFIHLCIRLFSSRSFHSPRVSSELRMRS